jgi:hypothetical protein
LLTCQRVGIELWRGVFGESPSAGKYREEQKIPERNNCLRETTSLSRRSSVPHEELIELC